LILTRKDLECRFTFANNRACQSFGKPLEEILGKTDFDFFPAELAQEWQRVDRKVFETGRTVELPPFLYIDMGEERYHQGIKTPLYDSRGKIIGVQIVIWDVTERKRLEEALRASEALYHSLVESLPCIVLRKDLEGRFTFANRRFCEILGCPLDPLLGKTDFDVFPQDLAEKYRRDDQQVIDTGEVFEDIEETSWVMGNRYCHTLKTAVRDAAGKVTGTQALCWDVTARKLAEEDLRKSQERFELAVQASQNGLWDWDIETGEVYYSPLLKSMLGYTEGEFPNRTEEWVNRLHPDDRDQTLATLEGCLTGTTSCYELEHRLRHRDGSYRWIRARGVVLRDASGKPYRMAGSHEDITDRKAAEEELARLQQRLEQSGIPGSRDAVVEPGVATRTVEVAAEQGATADRGRPFGFARHDAFPGGPGG
jgi:PAS domain S-box-containing protein